MLISRVRKHLFSATTPTFSNPFPTLQPSDRQREATEDDEINENNDDTRPAARPLDDQTTTPHARGIPDR
jgi:hypothetical protein